MAETLGVDGDVTRPVRILLVDDDERWTRVTQWHLEKNVEGFVVETASDLETGRQRYEASGYDCIVCDYQLGDGTGLELLETVRATDDDLPFVFVTGRGDEAVASEAIRSGTTEYIAKDEDDESSSLLTRCIVDAVRNYRTREALTRERQRKNEMLDVVTATTDPDELCHQFCTLLVEEYHFDGAWLGTVSDVTDSTRVYPRGLVGDDDFEGTMRQYPRTLPPPGQSTLETGELTVYTSEQTAADTAISDDASVVPDQEARELGFETALALPVRYNDVLSGILCLYADTGPAEIDFHSLREYGEIIGYALNAAELTQRERDIKLEVSVPVEDAPLGAVIPGDYEVEIPSVVLREDDSTVYLLQCDRDSDWVESVRDRTAAHDSVEFVAEYSDRSPVRVELRVTGTTAERALEEFDVVFERGVVTGEAITSMGTADTGISLDRLEARFRTLSEHASVEIMWDNRQSRESAVIEDILGELTDRQHDVLRHGYYAGFFERPRETTATELADQFGLARQTMTHHVRAAQRKVFDRLFERNS